MEKRCFLLGRKDSLFKQLVASLLIEFVDKLELFENSSVDTSDLLNEIKESRPDMLLLEESSYSSENSLLIPVLLNIPDLPVIVISEDSNFMHIIRRETRLLNSSHDLIETIKLI